ncbi:hypothetical protein L0222_23550 [bacterium]|nr:hypothetical protein [bacterium]MCI0607346.1 hypothetical protein [bacterium]
MRNLGNVTGPAVPQTIPQEQAYTQAIEKNLSLRLSANDKEGLQTRRENLRHAFELLSPREARELLARLETNKGNDPLSRLFHDKLSGASQKELLGILRTRTDSVRSQNVTAVISNQASPNAGAASKAAEVKLEGQARMAQFSSDAPPQTKAVAPQNRYEFIKKNVLLDAVGFPGQDRFSKIHIVLEGLSPQEYRATLDKMQKDGLLNKFIGSLSSAERDQFLAQASRKGYIQPGVQREVNAGPLNPPSSPALYKNDPSLPAAVRGAIHGHTMDSLKKYDRQYNDYIDRYTKAVKDAPTIADVRAMGPPAKKIQVSELDTGVGAGHPDYHKFNKDWNSRLGDRSNRAYEAIAHRIQDETGIQRPGTTWLKGTLTVEKESKGGKKESLEASAKVTDYGKVTTEGKGSVSAGPVTVEAGKDEKGELKTKVKVKAGPITAEGGDKDAKVGVSAQTKDGKSGIKMDSEGGEIKIKEKEIKVDDDGVKVSVPVGSNTSAGASADPKKGTMSGSVKGGVKIGGAKVEVELEVGLKTGNKEQVERALSPDNPGFFGRPPELEQGKGWKELSKERRELFESLGWTEKEWESKRKK